MATFPAGTRRAALQLQAVQEEDAGHFVCQALGEAGTASHGTLLDVGCEFCLCFWVSLGPQAYLHCFSF